MEETSLEDFLGADAGDEDADDSDTAANADDSDTAATTFAWSPDGGRCAACGEHVERRWRGEAGLICPGCKEW
ncbi:MAG: hypothetical protein ABEH56_02465 [Salinirussus sp.]